MARYLNMTRHTHGARFKARVGCVAAVISGVVAIVVAQSASQPAPASTLKPNSRLPQAEIRRHVDRQWVQDAATSGLLDYWVRNSVEPNGFIQENLDRQWKPWGTQREATVSTARAASCTSWRSATR